MSAENDRLTDLAKVLVIGIYRLGFHQLSKYPGPWFAAVTDWYTAYHIFIGDRHVDLYNLHKRHGH